ncbi:glycosyltransferase [Peteryoungia algae]|uniref:Glycosyltransferase n=1 Tax=Peteryoungia algae TaxID=2919917 RepID=A0ABT0D557_9HYPH|nr:glycosyltransferase [Rhizobium sp. SSM4.3]MCJ8240545.1 glycosyltransferase [Rhizobium sp. SSM4.3]
MSVSHVDLQTSNAKLRVFIHLAENKDAGRWKAGFADGSLVGINDDTPYGYGRANALGCTVSFSKAHRETLAGKMLRYGLRLLLGFDFVHAWRQRHEFENADVIWTHTESQYLAVAAVARLRGIRTKIIGQTVWLFDSWNMLSAPKRYLYSFLIKRVDVLTFLSPANMQVADTLFPDSDLRLVSFGIPAETTVAPRVRHQKPMKILAIGNDRHRDWRTLVDVVRGQPDFALTILSGTVPRRVVAGIPNVEVRLAKSTRELTDGFDAASVVCVPLQENLHASGITAIEEAVLAGVPVIASDTGGLRHYFSDKEIIYVPPGDRPALLDALLHVRDCPEEACKMAVRAQGRMGPGGLGADEYIHNHVRISHDILREGAELQTATAAVQTVKTLA